jgi:hypothetical protein
MYVCVFVHAVIVLFFKVRLTTSIHLQMHSNFLLNTSLEIPNYKAETRFILYTIRLNCLNTNRLKKRHCHLIGVLIKLLISCGEIKLSLWFLWKKEK